MKWNRFIVDQPDSQKRPPRPHLTASQRSSASPHKPFVLKSLERIKYDSSRNSKDVSIAEQENINDSAIRQMVNRVSVKTERGSVEREAPLPRHDRDNQRCPDEADELLALAEAFAQQFQEFLHSFFSSYQPYRARKEEQQELRQRLARKVEDCLDTYLSENQALVFRGDSPPRQPSISRAGKSPRGKKASRVINFKNQMILEKDGLQQAQASINEIQKILKEPSGEEERRQFARTSLRTSKHRKDRSVDSSVEEIMERSLNEGQRKSRSGLKSREALYRFSKVLNLNNV